MALENLNLLENAFDSFEEALKKFEEGSDINPKPYKFAIQHFAHFLELIMKHYVAQSHPLLIYMKPHSNLTTENDRKKVNTIGLWSAVQFLKNDGKEISKSFEADLKWLKGLRNDIEHHHFELKTEEVRLTLGRLMRAFGKFNSANPEIKVRYKVKPNTVKAFQTLSDEYKSKLHDAKLLAKGQHENDGEELACCDQCQEMFTMVIKEDVGHCYFCDEDFNLVQCPNCDEYCSEDRMVEVHPDYDHYVCENCYEEQQAMMEAY